MSSLTPEQLDWLVSEAQQRIDPESGVMPRGGWTDIQRAFSDRFGVKKSPEALKSQYFIIQHHGDKREYTASEVQAMLRGVNKVLASEGKPRVRQLTARGLPQFLQGRLMPDGTPWKASVSASHTTLSMLRRRYT